MVTGISRIATRHLIDRHASLLVFLLALALVAAACGDDDEAPATTQAPSGADADIALVRQVYSDLSAGNLDLATARIDTDRNRRLRDLWEFGTGLGVAYKVSQCTAAPQESATLVSCTIAPHHPVFDTLGIRGFPQVHTVREGRIVDAGGATLRSQLAATASLYIFARELEPTATEAVCGTQGPAIGFGDFFNAECGEHLSGFVDRFVTSRQTEN